MQDKVNLLLNLVTPYKLCKDLGVEIFLSDTCASIRDPLNKEDMMYITDFDFISYDCNKSWFRGNIVDFIARTHGITYKESVGMVMDKYLLELNDSFYKSLLWSKMSIAKYIEHNQKLINGLKELADEVRDGKGLSEGRDYVVDQGFQVVHSKRLFFTATGKRVKEIFEDCLYMSMESTASTKFHDSDTYAIFPYYANYHTVPYIEAVHLKSRWVNRITIHKEYKKSYLGLDTTRPSDKFTTLCKSLQNTLDTYKLCLDYVPESPGCIFVKEHSGGTITPSRIIRSRIPKDTGTTIEYIVDSLQHVEDLRVSFGENYLKEKFTSSYSARDFLVKNFFYVLRNEVHATDTVCEYLSRLKRDTTLSRLICAELKAMGRSDIISKTSLEPLENSSLDVRGNKVNYTPDGYILTSKDGYVTPLTNFGLKLDYTIVFKKNNDTYYRGSVLIAGFEYPITVSKKYTQDHKLLLSSITAAIARDIDVTSEESASPAILDTTCASYINNIIAHEIHSTTMVVGLDVLGWDESRTCFNSVNWRVTSNGISSEQRILHPGEKGLKNFEFKNLRQEDPEVSLTDSCTHLFGLLTSFLVYARDSVRMYPIFVRDSPCNRNILSALLSPFCQTTPIELNSNFRKNTIYLDYVRGHPVICLSSNELVLDSINEPVFVLGPAGMDLSMIEDDVKDIVNFSEWFIPNLIHKLLSSDAITSKFPIDNDSYNVSDLIQIGCSMNSELTRLECPEGSLFLDQNSSSGDVIKFTQEVSGTDNLMDGGSETSIPSM